MKPCFDRWTRPAGRPGAQQYPERKYGHL